MCIFYLEKIHFFSFFVFFVFFSFFSFFPASYGLWNGLESMQKHCWSASKQPLQHIRRTGSNQTRIRQLKVAARLFKIFPDPSPLLAREGCLGQLLAGWISPAIGSLEWFHAGNRCPWLIYAININKHCTEALQQCFCIDSKPSRNPNCAGKKTKKNEKKTKKN